MSTNLPPEQLAQVRWAQFCDRKLAEATKAAQERAGRGWDLFTGEVQSALIAYQLLTVINTNEETPGWEKASDLVARFFQNVDKTGE